ncbi:MAG: arsenic resistance N-acetyltransferase ArsN2 [Gemmatirosa sp.]
MIAPSHDTVAPVLRTATPADLAAVRRLLADCELPDAGVDALFATHAADFVVAEATDADGRAQLVGVAGLEVCRDDALLRSVAVRPEWRAHGVGRDLVKRLVCMAEARGLHALYLLTMTAEHYFPRFGFETVERGAVPAAIAETLEFRSACPASAVAMARPLHA